MFLSVKFCKMSLKLDDDCLDEQAFCIIFAGEIGPDISLYRCQWPPLSVCFVLPTPF